MTRMLSTFALVAALGLTACGASPRVPAAPTPAQPWPADADAAVRAAIQDGAAKLKVKPDAVHVVSVTATDWPDSSLGCPQPGMFYMQIIVPGYAIVLEAGGQQVEYHANKNGRVVTCK